jgi:glutamate 5-kinase
VNYSAEEVAIIAGAHSREIERRLGHVGHEEIIHRDNMVA